MESKFQINGGATWFDTTDIAWRINEYDEYAIEQAVQLKEQVGDGDITVLSIGPDKVKEAIKKALAMGCDRGIHLVDDMVSEKEPAEIASIITAFARDKQFDMIFTGMQSQDRGSGQVGVLLAEMLSFAAVTTIVDFSYHDGSIQVKRELEGGIKAKIGLKIPALVTCQLGLNTPRYPTLPNIMKAKKKELLSLPAEELLSVKGRQQTARVYFPEKKGGGVVLEGEPERLADELIMILKEKTSVFA